MARREYAHRRALRRIAAVLVFAALCGRVPVSISSGAVSDPSATLRAAGVEFAFVRVPARRFLMGSDIGSSDERPAHEVAIPRDLHMMRTEVALRKPVSSSDSEPVIGELEMITDADKEAGDGSFVELGPFAQQVTIDLQGEYEIYAVHLWHYHQESRVYFDVIVQVSSDPDFAAGAKTLFNNDMDDSAGLGAGRDMHYVDTHFGELFDARGIRGRYVRLYSNGSTADDLNHYIEVEVYGRPLPEGPKLRK